MATPVIMPKQGQSVESCIITKWYKNKGEAVKTGDILFAYETDKASFEEEAKANGILLDILFAEGDEVPVLSEVAYIGQAGESVISKKNDTVTVETQENKVEQKTEITVQPKENTKVAEKFVSPLARRMAREMGVEICAIKGTGPHGRVIKQDILAHSENNSKDTAKKIVTSFGTDGYSDVKLSNIRKIIGKAMHESLQNSAQLTHHMSADVRRLLQYRNQLKNSQGSPDITLNDMICYCVIRALKKMPEVNSQYLGHSVRTFEKVHLGLAVDTTRGLMVPVLRAADDYSLQGLSSQLKTLAVACRNGSVNPDLLSSNAASFTVSNLGAYGVEMFTPVVNLPQVAILGVCTIINRPADLGNGVFGFVPYIGLSLTYDHRALDGGPATLFLKEIKTEIENFSI